MKDMKDPKDALAEREKALAAREQALAAREKAAAEQQVAAFAEKVVAEGKLLPAERDGFIAIATALGAGEATLAFGEGKGVTKVSPRGWLEQFVSGLPKRVEYSELSRDESESDTQPPSRGTPQNVNPSRQGLHQKALAYAAQHKVDYVTAVEAVERSTK